MKTVANVEPQPERTAERAREAPVGGSRESIAVGGLNGAGHVDIGFYLFPEHLEW